MNFGRVYLGFLTLIMCYVVAISEKTNQSRLQVQTECSSDKLVVKGYDVNITQVSIATCVGIVKFIEVFALNQLFIDADFDATGQQVQLSLIAPTWVIIGKRKIILDGKNGDKHASLHAPDGIGSYINGRPGKPGVSAGRLLGIANNFIGGSKLEISMNGGEGGAGQHGGKGMNGIDGVDPPIPDNSTIATSLWESVGFFYKTTMNQTESVDDGDIVFTFLNLRVFGRNSTRPGDGGNGGVGGIGGYAGKHIIVGLENHQEFSVFAKAGYDGVAGKGGACFEESRHGYTLDVFFRDEYNSNNTFEAGKPSPSPLDNVTRETGLYGIDGGNDIGVSNPDAVDFINPWQVINNYKSFVRKYLVFVGDNSSLNQFIGNMDENERINTLYDTTGLVDEMLRLENQYFELKDSFSLTPYFDSILKRTVKYAQNFTESTGKDALSWFYTTVMMRFSAVQTTPILNLLDYLDEIDVHISNLRHNEMEVNVHNQQCTLNSEIRSVSAFIESKILPEFQNILSEIGSYVSSVIHELFERQYKFEVANSSLPHEFFDSDSINSLMAMPRDKMYPFEVLNSIAMIENENLYSNLPSTFTESTLEIRENRESLQLFMKQLNDILQELNHFTTFIVSEKLKNELLNITRKVSASKLELSQQMQNDLLIPKGNDIDLMRDKLIFLFEKKQSELHSFEDLSSLFDSILVILRLKKIPIQLYKKLSVESITKMLNFFEIANQMEIEATNSYVEIENIYDTILKRFLDFEESVNEIIPKLYNKSKVELEESKWRTLSAVRDTGVFFRKLSNETSVKDLLYRSIEKLDDNIISLFEAYDYIDHLNKEKSNHFAVFQYSLDNTLNGAVVNLKKMIQINVLLENYELAVKAFETHQFPFGNKILKNLYLPNNIQPDNPEKLAEVVIDRFDYLRKIIKTVDTSIGMFSHLRFSDVDFNNDSSTGSFYIWKYSDISKEIRELLNGKEIELLADIEEVRARTAVKFNKIGIRFKRNGKEILKSGILTMSMGERADYRCSTHTHSVTMDGSISLTYSLDHNSNGEPVYQNEVYRQLKVNPYFLSPYTTWKIKLAQHNFEKNIPMDLELFGQGEYIVNNYILYNVCKNL